MTKSNPLQFNGMTFEDILSKDSPLPCLAVFNYHKKRERQSVFKLSARDTGLIHLRRIRRGRGVRTIASHSRKPQMKAATAAFMVKNRISVNSAIIAPMGNQVFYVGQ